MFLSHALYPVLGSLKATLDQPLFPGKVLVWLLFILSIAGWVMIISKVLELRKMKRMDQLFTDRLRKSKSILEVFEEGWEDDASPKHLIYLAGAREASYQLLGSREPQEMMQSRLKEAGKLAGRQIDFLRMAIQTGYRSSVARLQSGIEGFRLLVASSVLLGTFGFIWSLMTGFDQAKDYVELAPKLGGALGYCALAVLVASPAVLARISFQATVRRRKQELSRFRDDINRLFERSFAAAEVPGRPPEPAGREKSRESGENSPPETSSDDGKKRFHSIRERLLRSNTEEEEDPFVVNPIARQAASAKGS